MTSPPSRAAGVSGPSDEEVARWMAEYGPALRRYFTRKAGSAHADDLVQDVFVRLQARADKAPLQNAEGFIFTLAKRVLIDRYRFDVARGAALHEPLDAAGDFADEISPERILAAKQDYDRAVVAVMQLPPRMRQAFILHRFGKLSYAAIAKRMGIKKTTVQNLMERAIERFMESMGGRS